MAPFLVPWWIRSAGFCIRRSVVQSCGGQKRMLAARAHICSTDEMADETIIGASHSALRRRKAWLPQVDSGIGGLALLILGSALVVLPPFFYLIKSSVTIP